MGGPVQNRGVVGRSPRAGADGSTAGPRRQSWKVLVLGNSVTTQVARRSRHDGTYGEVLGWLLGEAGYDVDVRNAGRWFEEIDDGFRRFVAEELTEFPDVLVVHYGFNESRALVLPRALLQHFTRMRLHTWDEGMRWAGRAYRRVFVPRLWRVVRRYQQLASAAAGVRLWRMTPARFARELRRLITFARGERMLVLVADLIPPPPKILHFIPGMDDRRAIYQRTLSQVISGFDDDEVRLVTVSRVVDELGFDEALTDGLHFSPLGHRRVAEIIAAEVAPWLDAHAAADPRPSAPAPGGSRPRWMTSRRELVVDERGERADGGEVLGD